LNGRALSDITFLDSLTGFTVTDGSSSENAYILKTTNGGDNWNIKYSANVKFNDVQFINSNTGFVNAYVNQLYKTTNGGENWFTITLPSDLFSNGMWVLNEDTIWLAQDLGGFGGLFRTTNGGVSWTQQFSGNPNPSKIYMFNRNIGFISAGSGLLKTTNSGDSWNAISGTRGFINISFIDSLTGWKTTLSQNKDSVQIQKTTNGGLNWVTQTLPSGGIILTSAMTNFFNVNRDTIWGVGGNVFYGPGQARV